MVKKKAGIAVLLIVFIFVACGCGESDESKGASRKLGFTAMDMTDPAFRVAKSELEMIVNGNGDELISADGRLDNETQIQAIEKMIDQGIAVLFLNPVDAEAIEPALKKCREAGIKVICFDSKVKADQYIETFVSGDNYKLGTMIGERIKEDYPQGAVLAVFTNPLANSIQDRTRGLEEALAGSNIKMIYGADISTYDDVLPAGEKIMKKYPQINVIWGFNDDLCLMLHSMVLAQGRENQIAIYGTGGQDSAIRAIQEGKVKAISAQNYGDWGKICGELCYKMLAGDKLKPSYFVESFIIDEKNVNEYENN